MENMVFVRNYPAHCLDGSYAVTIVAVETPCRIYVTRNDESSINERFLDLVRKYDQAQLHRLLEEEIFSGSPVFVALEGEFHRGSIVDGALNTETIRVWLGDYATEVTVGLEDLYTMPMTFRDRPWQTLACGLAGIQPVRGEKWSADTCDALRHFLVGCGLVMRTFYPDDTAEALWVDLEYTDVEEGFISVIDKVVKIGHAQPASRQCEFDWGDGVCDVSDRRRVAEIDRKRYFSEQTHESQRESRTRTVDVIVPQALWFDTDEDWDHSSLTMEPSPYDDQPDTSTSRRFTVYRSAFDSCGETDDESDIE